MKRHFDMCIGWKVNEKAVRQKGMDRHLRHAHNKDYLIGG